VKRTITLLTLLTLVALAGACAVEEGTISEVVAEGTVTTVVEVSETTVAEETTTTAAPTTTTEPALPVISSGTYIVPDELAPGQYRVSGYFARLDANMNIIDNDGVYGEGELTFMEVRDTDAYVEISGEAIAVDAFREYLGGGFDPIAAGAEGGTYLVGEDVAPGRYRVEDETYAYAARLKCNRDIISNAGNSGSVIIVVADSDCLFEFSGRLSRID
jgi:hypothetical protein